MGAQSCGVGFSENQHCVLIDKQCLRHTSCLTQECVGCYCCALGRLYIVFYILFLIEKQFVALSVNQECMSVVASYSGHCETYFDSRVRSHCEAGVHQGPMRGYFAASHSSDCGPYLTLSRTESFCPWEAVRSRMQCFDLLLISSFPHCPRGRVPARAMNPAAHVAVRTPGKREHPSG